MSLIINIMISATFLLLAYRAGLHDGRIMECRVSFNTVEEAPQVWDACRQRLGTGYLR